MTDEPFPAPSAPAAHRFINRELSWLEFDARVLALAEDPERPLLERVKFLLDLRQQPRRVLPDPRLGPGGAGGGGCDRHHPRRHDAPRAARGGPAPGGGAHRRAPRTLWLGELKPALEKQRIRLVDWDQLDDDDKRLPGPAVPRADLPRAHPAVRRSRPPVPLHLEPLAEPRGRRARPDHGRAPLRPREGAAAAPAVHRAARRRAVRPARAGDRGPPRPALPRAWTSSRTTCSGSRAMPTSRSRRTRPTTSSPRSRRSCSVGSEAPRRSVWRSTPRMTDEVRSLLIREMGLDEPQVYVDRRAHRHGRPLVLRGARSARAEGRARGPR